MRTIFLDIETMPLPIWRREFMRPNASTVRAGNLVDPGKIAAKINKEIAAFESGQDASLDELQAEVCVIGYAIGDNCVEQIYHGDEKHRLNVFWNLICDEEKHPENETIIVAYNVRFDGAMLIHRSWLNEVKVPHVFEYDLLQYKPNRWRDPMLYWQLGDRHAGYRSLGNICSAFGIPVKSSDINGSNFYLNWPDRKEECLEYNRNDVLALRELYHRLKM